MRDTNSLFRDGKLLVPLSPLFGERVFSVRPSRRRGLIRPSYSNAGNRPPVRAFSRFVNAGEERMGETDDERSVRDRAYFLWLEEGQPEGRALNHWQRAAGEMHAEAEER